MPTGTIGSAMQPAVAPPRTCRRTDALPLAAGLVAFAALLVLTRPYRGIALDAEIYVGQALASFDPHGLGRDLLFAFDEQFRFSAWPAAARRLVGAVGPGAAALGLAAFGIAAWAVACAALAGRLLPRGLLVAGLVAAATLSPLYGGFTVFRYAENFATPRSLAEACVLAGLACFVAGRRLAMAGCLAAALVVHPIMALPGLATAAVLAAGTVRRGVAMAAAAALLAVAGAAAGLPVLSRLLVAPDPVWSAALDVNPYLFPSRWSAGAWSVAAVQLATILVARRSLAGRARAVAGAVALVGTGGALTALVVGDALSSLLVLQVQTWRALWLVALLANLLLPLALVAGWREGSGSRLAAAVLALAWLIPDAPSAAAAALVAWAADAAARRGMLRIDGRIAGVAWAGAGCVLVLFAIVRAVASFRLLESTPAGAGSEFELWGAWLPLLGAVLVVAVRPSLRPPAPVAVAGAVLLAGLAAASWDGRSDFGRLVDAGRPDPALVRLLPDEPGPILWLGSQPRRSWMLAGRPNWVSYAQGAPMVFSRPLMLVWSDRMGRLAEAGLADAYDRSPQVERRGPPLRPGRAAIEAFCAAPDAPLAIVVPLSGRVVLPPDLRVAIYRPASPAVEAEPESDPIAWSVIERFAVVACRETAARQGAGPGLRPGLRAG